MLLTSDYKSSRLPTDRCVNGRLGCKLCKTHSCTKPAGRSSEMRPSRCVWSCSAGSLESIIPTREHHLLQARALRLKQHSHAWCQVLRRYKFASC